MRSHAPLLGSLLEEWLNRLDADGFQIGIRERLTLQAFLLDLAARHELPTAPVQVLQLIAPLLCTSPDSQRRYAALLADFLAARLQRPLPKAGREALRATSRQADRTHPRLRRAWFIGLLLVLLVGAGAALHWFWPPANTEVEPPAPLPGPVAPRVLEEYRPPAAEPAEPPSNTAAQGAMQLAAWICAGISGVLLAWAAWFRLRRALYLQGVRADAAIETHVLHDPAAGRLEPPEPLIRLAARGLRQRIAGEREVLDLPATLAATVRAAGAFSPRYRRLRHTPEYLALIDRRHAADHLAAYADAVLAALSEHGVAVQAYDFSGTPERGCWRRRRDGIDWLHFDHSGIAELAARYAGHRLLVFAEADVLLDPLSGGCPAWVQQFAVFPQRAWFTPMPMASWGRAEMAVDGQGFLLLPSPAEALATLAAWFASGDLSLETVGDWPLTYPELLKGQAVAWVARQHPPPPPMLQELLFQLRAYLGARRTQWLCACAILPALSPGLTLTLGKQLSGDARELALGMASLAALPWFRHGHMPDWLRQSLLAHLNPENAALFREAIELHLARALTGNAGEELVRVAARRRLLAWLGQGRGMARDVVLVDFLQRGVAQRLALRLPDVLRRHLFRDGLALRGPRPSVLASLLTTFALAMLALSFEPAALPPSAAQKPVVDFIACVDPLGVDPATRALVNDLARAPAGTLGLASGLDATAFAPAAWQDRSRQLPPAPGEILHARSHPEQRLVAERVRAWLAGAVPATAWRLRETAAALDAVTIGACLAAAAPPQDPSPSLPPSPAPATVYIQMGDEAQRPWAEALATRLRAAGFKVPAIEKVAHARLPERSEIRRQGTGDRKEYERIGEVLMTDLRTPAVQSSLPARKDGAADGHVYEIWPASGLCSRVSVPACGPVPPHILSFSAQPDSIVRGAPAKLCYVVTQATTLRIDPTVGSVRNLAKNCLNVTPERTTTYTLTAQGESGRAVKRSTRILVLLPPTVGETAADAAAGWCCVPADVKAQSLGSVRLLPMAGGECRKRAGKFYEEEKQARAECTDMLPLPGHWAGVDVAEIQASLRRLGYFQGAIDAVPSEALIEALRRFQADNRLPADGDPGPKTLATLRRADGVQTMPWEQRNLAK